MEELDKQKFYEQFPEFDWNYYINNYLDLQKNNIDNEEKAISHYLENGQFEQRRTHILVPDPIDPIRIPLEDFLYHYEQAHISNALASFESRFLKYFNLNLYESNTIPTVFFGIYTTQDLQNLLNHKSIKVVIWGGTDANINLPNRLSTILEVKKIPNIIHFSISKNIYNNLLSQNIPSIFVNLNMVDKNLFHPPTSLGNKIFIFNGQKPGQEPKYGENIYKEIIRRLPDFEFIFSCELNVSHDEMYSIYKQCFIMLRLTDHDGNANSVQECEAMKIPVIHNQSEYGIKWKSVDDIVQLIQQYNPK